MATILATVRYYLSEQGRRHSLKQGGNGRRLQEVMNIVPPDELDAFVVNDEGQASFDMTELHGCDPDLNPKILPPASKGRFENGEILWDVVPTWEDLLGIVRGFKNECDDMAASYEDQQKKLNGIAEKFLAEPAARPDQLRNDRVKIDGEWFYGAHAALDEAKRRAALDVEEVKTANRGMLREWIIRNGTDNQRERLFVDLLPWKEAFETVEEHFFQSLKNVPRYRRFEPSEVPCECTTEFKCEPKFQSVDAAELTADEWDQFAKIKGAAPAATFQFREHRAKCVTATQPKIRRGVIVKFTLGQLTFKREFALTFDEVPL